MKTKVCATILALSFFFFFSPILLSPSAAETDVSEKIGIFWGGTTFDQKTGTTFYTLGLRNTSRETLSGPFRVVVEQIDNSYVSIINPDGYTTDGKPYFIYNKDSLAPWGKTSSKVWKFQHQCKRLSVILFKEIRFFQKISQWECSWFATCYTSIFNGTVTNHPPVAEAGPDQDVTVGSLVTLDGRNSSDPDGDLIMYNWSIAGVPPGSSAALDNPASVVPTFTPDKPGIYTLSLVVSDGKASSTPDFVQITAALPNVAPTANAGPDQSVITGSIVYLDGNWSFDPDGDPLAYYWQILSKPDGSNAYLSDLNSVSPNFTTDRDGDYFIQLTVSDGSLYSLPDDVIVVSATPNAPPVAYAGDDQIVSKNTAIQLDGRMSSDPNNDPLTYSWTMVSKPEGSTSELDDPSSSTPQILADKVGDYVFTLVVFDGEFYSNPDTIVVTVVNDPPIANAGPDQDGVVGVPTILNGGGSSDSNGDTLTYQWSIISAPSGNSASILNPTSVTPTITPNVPGIYVIHLVVNDGNTDSTPDTVNLTVRVTVPNVVGQPQASAETAITGAGLTVGTITQATSNTVPAGNVISQNPLGGTLALAGSPVSLTISLGPAPFLVPNVVGMTQSAATTAIQAAGLQVGTATTANSPTVPAGSVISQNPPAGSSVPEGSSVSLVVSLGPVMVTVPNVVGMTQANAEAAITSANLTVGTITTANSDTVPAGSVISQNPAGASSVTQGSSVNLVISLGSSIRQVGPQGGKFEFANGVILDIPPGAVTETVGIEITDLSCEEVDAIISSQRLATHKKRCLRGFSAKPDGLTFNVPIKALVPVALGPGEIPVKIEVDLNNHVQWTLNAELEYRGSDAVVEMSLQHFSDEWLAALQQNQIEQECKRCDTYVSYKDGKLWCGPLSDPSPVFAGLQPGACQLLQPEREKCAPGVRCCMEELMYIKVTEADFTSGKCQIVGGEISVTFPACDGSPTLTDSQAESAGCPEDTNYELEIVSDEPWIYRCQQANLKAELTGTSKDGTVLLEAAAFPADWEIVSGDSSVAELGLDIPPNGKVVKGLNAGDAIIRAKALGKEDINGDYTLSVKELKFEIQPGEDQTLFVGDSMELWVPCVACPQGITWTTDPDPTGVVSLASLPGDAVRVTGNERGTARVIARSLNHCGETIEDSLIVEVKKTKVTLAPEQATIPVGGMMPLTATVIDGEGCTLEWYSNNVDVAEVTPGGLVSGISPGVANISAVCGDAIGVSVITVAVPGFILTWTGTRSESKDQMCTFLSSVPFGGPGTSEFFITHSQEWSGTAIIDHNGNVPYLSTTAFINTESSTIRKYLLGDKQCSDIDKGTTSHSLNPTGFERIKQQIETSGIHIVQTEAGPRIIDPLLGSSGCFTFLETHQVFKETGSVTCPDPSEYEYNIENEVQTDLCFHPDDTPPTLLRPDDETRHSFSKNIVYDFYDAYDYDCGYGVTGPGKHTIHSVWKITVTKVP
jgi:beta-lactam-binding protein with PASTA domain